MYFVLVAVLLAVLACKHFILTPAHEISLVLVDSRPLPANTITVLNFDKVIIRESDRIILAQITDTLNPGVIYDVQIPDNKNYHSIQHLRYLILEDRTGDYFQSVLDMADGSLIDLQEPSATTGGTSIAPNDAAMLYNARFRDPGNGKELLENRLRTWNGQTKTVVDSVIGTLWAPNGKWFLAAKRVGREGQSVLWERALFDRQGKKISLPSKQFSVSRSTWSEDGLVLAMYHPWDAIVTIVEFDWTNDIPHVKNHTTESGFNGPFLWSPNGQHLIYVKYHDDGHTAFGNDIMLTDRSLSMRKALIEHANIEETPITWSREHGLVTQITGRINRYRIIL